MAKVTPLMGHGIDVSPAASSRPADTTDASADHPGAPTPTAPTALDRSSAAALGAAAGFDRAHIGDRGSDTAADMAGGCAAAITSRGHPAAYSPPLAARSEPDASTCHWTADGAQQPQHRADHQQDDADRLQNRDAEHDPEDQQDDAEDDHFFSNRRTDGLPGGLSRSTVGFTRMVCLRSGAVDGRSR